ncbi:hypothetical protein K458DRAFT_452824 [Lentithecium fluviatile CBS 122367]|uniref:Rhodopsin domain-containing protein n=1 Tax=Lentithecium fluviatile CBS 122367 TaxID=1168545 RepID=A0A6G1IZD2_9PLEO|nr:hypothetical protein K458DRAFT_452824 [Lentithecium fluviatile CBS 122367]
MDIQQQGPANTDKTLTTSCIAVTTAACVLVVISTILRYLGRWVLQKRQEIGKGRDSGRVYGLDDVFNILSLLAFSGLAAAAFVAIERGMGMTLDTVLEESGVHGLIQYNQAIYVCAIFYNTSLGLIKLSVLSLYHRILRGVQSQILRNVVWGMFILVAANTTANVLVAIFQCWPIEAAWDISIPKNDKRCVNINAFYLGNAITGVTTDALVYFLSIPIILPLNLSTKTKLQLLATMLVGFFAVVTSAVRLGFIPALLHADDTTMAMAVPMNWSVAEPAVGILVSSMPAIRAVRFLLRGEGVRGSSYASGSGIASGNSKVQSELRSRGGQIKLEELERGRTGDTDTGSEERLVVGRYGSVGLGQGQISKKTDVEVSYSTK